MHSLCTLFRSPLLHNIATLARPLPVPSCLPSVQAAAVDVTLLYSSNVHGQLETKATTTTPPPVPTTSYQHHRCTVIIRIPCRVSRRLVWSGLASIFHLPLCLIPAATYMYVSPSTKDRDFSFQCSPVFLPSAAAIILRYARA